MMQLIIEDKPALIDGNFHALCENVDGKKVWSIEGVYAQSEVINRNRRKYSREILGEALRSFDRSMVKDNRGLGELEHPKRHTIDPERVCHRVTTLNEAGNDWHGRSVITNTPMGKIVSGLLECEAKIGVSTRGYGTTTDKGDFSLVNEDFGVITFDVVTNPSAPDAFVNGILEGVDLIWDNGILKAELLESYSKKAHNTPKRLLPEAKIQIWNDIMNRIASKDY